MQFILIHIRKFKIGSWEVQREENYTILNAQDPDARLENILGFPNTSFSKKNQNAPETIANKKEKKSFLRKLWNLACKIWGGIYTVWEVTGKICHYLLKSTWNLLNTAHFNHAETQLDINCEHSRSDFGNIFAIMKLGKFTTINLENAKLKQKQLTEIVNAFQENHHTQHFHLPKNATKEQLEKAQIATFRNQSKAKLSRWYTNPIKHFSYLGLGATSALLLFSGYSFVFISNLLFNAYIIGAYLDNKRESRFLEGHRKMHTPSPTNEQETSPSPSPLQKAYNYGENVSRGWLPYATAWTFGLTSTVKNYDAYLTGLGEGLVKQEQSRRKHKR